MKTPPFNLFQPKTIEEAIEISSNFVKNDEQFDWISWRDRLITKLQMALKH